MQHMSGWDLTGTQSHKKTHTLTNSHNFAMIPLDKLQEDTKINETVQGNFI